MPPRLSAVLAELGLWASTRRVRRRREPAGRVVVRAQRCPREPCCKRRCRRPDFPGDRGLALGTSDRTGGRASHRLDRATAWRQDGPRSADLADSADIESRLRLTSGGTRMPMRTGRTKPPCRRSAQRQKGHGIVRAYRVTPSALRNKKREALGERLELPTGYAAL